MKLSIITVNLNNREGLQRTIDSVATQTFRDYEWIVVDGGSTDGSKELIERHSGCFAYWVSEPDKGIYNAMNKGALKATGEYLLYLNSGDRLLTQDTLLECFASRHGEDILYGDAIYDFPDGDWTYHTPAAITARYLINGGTILHSGGSFVKRQLLVDGGLYDESLKIVADWKFFLQSVVLGGATTRHLGITLSRYDTEGLSSTNQELLQRERDAVLSQLFAPAVLADYRYMSAIEKENKGLREERYTVDALADAPFRKLTRALVLKLKTRLFHKTQP